MVSKCLPKSYSCTGAFCTEKRFYSKPENKLLSPKECKVWREEKVKEKESSSCSSSCNALEPVDDKL